MAKVLVVDDVADNVALLTYELADHGYKVVSAFNGRQALELARSARPDVILLDVMMPGMDGYEVCRRLKEDPELRSIPVIIISAREQEDDVVRGLDVGAHDYVTKPFRMPVVLARVRSATRAKASHDLIVEMNARLAEHATIDGLTGLKNRGYFREELHNQCRIASRSGAPLSLILLDVDWFKQYNDSYGHPAGDDVLCVVGSLFRDAAISPVFAARYGGEEFALLLPDTPAVQAFRIAEELRIKIADQRWPLRAITVSLGASTSNPGPINPQRLVEEADQAMYYSKQKGRNVSFHYRDLETELAENPDLKASFPQQTSRLYQY